MALRATCPHVGAVAIIAPSGLVCSRCDAPIVDDGKPRPYSQKDGERRPGWGRKKHLRVWKLAREAGHAGALEEGRARLLTEEACVAFGSTAATKTKPRATVVTLRTNDDDVATELGLGRRRTG